MIKGIPKKKGLFMALFIIKVTLTIEILMKTLRKTFL